MARDAAFAFSNSSQAVIATALNPHAQPQQQQQGLSLNLGPVSLNVGGTSGGVLEGGIESARDGLMDLFGRVKNVRL